MKDLALTPIRLGVLTATLGGAAFTMVWVATYRVSVSVPAKSTGTLVAWGFSTTYASPAWTTPVAALVALAAVAVAAVVLRRR